MTIETALHNLKELHDNIKEHPYWISFKHDMLNKKDKSALEAIKEEKVDNANKK